MEYNSYLALWVVIWVVVIGFVVASRWRRGAVGVGLPFAFLLSLWLNHWLGAVIYLLPWYLKYDLENNLGVIEAGFQQTTYALVGFALGSIILAPLAMRVFQFPGKGSATRFPASRFAKIFMVIGVLCFLVELSPIGRLPTFSALIAAGRNSLLVGLCLACWDAWQENRRTAFLGWLLVALSFPLLGLVLFGFLGLGVMLFSVIFAFLAGFLRPRWRLVVLALFLGYLGISAYGTYKRDREILRQVIWYEDASLGDRVTVVYDTFSNFEWFDPSNLLHLYLIDGRLNMNRQVGQAVEYLAAGNAEYAAGSTLWWSIAGMIPRALWPGKPVIAGGSELVSYYTGIEFGEGTSVGIGLVMEFYVNYGAAAVFLGFLFLGTIVTAVDVAAGRRLSEGDWKGFVFWFLTGLALVNPGNSLVELTTTAGAAVVTAYLVNNYLLARLGGKRILPVKNGPGASFSPARRSS